MSLGLEPGRTFKTRQKPSHNAALSFVTVVLIASLLAGCLDDDNPFEVWPEATFSSDSWKATDAPNRFVFIRDLNRQGLLDGASRDRVRQLLGKPDYSEADGRYVTYIVKYADPGERTLNSVYLLHVDFSANGVVSGYRVRGD